MTTVEVSIRVKPLIDKSQQNAVQINNNTIKLTLLDTQPRTFQFDQILDQFQSQQSVYDQIQHKQTINFINDQNTTTICYGQTSSGKSHTCGFSTAQNGLVIRTFDHILRSKSSLNFSLFQIYNDEIFDLLAPRNALKLKETERNNFEIQNLITLSVSTMKEAEKQLQIAIQNRISAPTLINLNSSRSHTILRCYSNGKTLQIIDLAGSERVKKSNSEDLRLGEAISINQSLACLGNVISALQKQSSHIPFRDSVLTKILAKTFFSGRISILVMICSEINFSGESLSSLIFANKCKNIPVKPLGNGPNKVEKLLKKYKIDDENIEKLLTRIQSEHASLLEIQRIKYEGLVAFYKCESVQAKEELKNFLAQKPAKLEFQTVKNSKFPSSATLLYQSLQQIAGIVEKITQIGVEKPKLKRNLTDNLKILQLEDTFIQQTLTVTQDKIRQLETNLNLKDHICAGKCNKCVKMGKFVTNLLKNAGNEDLQASLFQNMLNRESQMSQGSFQASKVYKSQIIPEIGFFSDEKQLSLFVNGYMSELMAKLQIIESNVGQTAVVRQQNQELRLVSLQLVIEHAIDILNVSKLLDEQNCVAKQQVTNSPLLAKSKSYDGKKQLEYHELQASRSQLVTEISSDDEFNQLDQLQKQVKFL